ncbi:MAG: 3'(2'),5'-bisphosphate nucleotidase CysQ [Maricaulaceae bacterium]
MTDAISLDRLVETALAAGRVILDVRDGAMAVERKSDDSPVTLADRAAEQLILRELETIAPGLPVVAEEAVAAGRIPKTEADFILVDPLDGTKEFVKGGRDFTVNIGVIVQGEPVIGVVYAPASGRLFAGRKGAGAWQAEVDCRAQSAVKTTSPIAVRPAPAAGFAAVASKSHRTPETDAFLERYKLSELVSAGSSLKFCLLAAGEADLYPRLGRTMEWDTAAGDAVLRAAGGRTVTLDGARLSYGKRNQAEDADFANPWFVALGQAPLIDAEGRVL